MRKQFGDQACILTPILIDDFVDMTHWVNVTPDTRWWVEDGKLRGHWGPGGSDLWSRDVFDGDIHVAFTATLLPPDPAWTKADLPEGGKNINLRFLVQGPQGGDIIEAYPALGKAQQGPNGVGDDQYLGYFFTFTHTHARLRRSPGYDKVSEDLAAIPQIGRAYHIEAIKIANCLRYYLDGERIHDYTDPQPHTTGRLGLTLWRSAVSIENFHVSRVSVEKHR